MPLLAESDRPTVVRAVEPRIPQEIRNSERPAKVIVEFRVSSTGCVEDVEVIYTSHAELKEMGGEGPRKMALQSQGRGGCTRIHKCPYAYPVQEILSGSQNLLKEDPVNRRVLFHGTGTIILAAKLQKCYIKVTA